MNLDSIIFISFLVANIALGLYSSRGIKSIREYAVGNKDFSTVTIAATLVATWISGEYFFTQLYETYANGLYFIWVSTLGNLLCFLSVGIILAPRMAEFLGKLSIAEAMGDLFGKNIRIITAIAGFIGASGMIAIQLKVAGLLFEYCFGISYIYGIIIGGVIVTFYSAVGGIRSVTFTDIIQLFTFGMIIPTIAFFILGQLDSAEIFISTLVSHPLFDYSKIFDFRESKSLYYLFLFFFIAIPALDPAIFQRIVMAKNTTQVRQSFIIAGCTCLFLTLTISLIGALVISTNHTLGPNEIVKHIIFDYSYVGLKGLTLAGIMAMVMSTIDSYINSTAVLIVHDFCKPIGIKIKDELKVSRIASLLIGIFAVLLALREGSLLQLLITTSMFYMPIVTVPFMMAIFGFRSSGKSVLIGMVAGFSAVIIWEMFLKTGAIDGLIPGMVANLVFLLTSHYLLKQPGGWVGIKDEGPLQALRQQHKFRRQKLIDSIVNFNLITFLRKNSPTSEAMCAYLGLFCIILIYASMYTIPKDIKLQYDALLNFITPSALFLATAVISYPLWPASLKNSAGIVIIWNITVFYVLVFIGLLFVIISNFAPLQLIILMANLLILASLVSWQVAIFMIVAGLFITTQVVKFYLGTEISLVYDETLKFKIVYLLVLISSILVVFLKPKQDQHLLSKEKNDHLTGRITERERALATAEKLKEEFIRNVTHEIHAPMTGIMSTVQVLFDGYDQLSDDMRKLAINTIYNSSIRLEAFDNNLRNLSKLSNAHYDLSLNPVNLSNLVLERIDICKKLYSENTQLQEFVTDIEDNIVAAYDEYYIQQTLDNLIINALTYCKKGKIIIKLKMDGREVEFSVADEGIGIPKEELYDIFGAFTVSSRTRTPAGGRGIGLALCKKVIELHRGRIWAESNGVKGAVFKFVLPSR